MWDRLSVVTDRGTGQTRGMSDVLNYISRLFTDVKKYKKTKFLSRIKKLFESIYDTSDLYTLSPGIRVVEYGHT